HDQHEYGHELVIADEPGQLHRGKVGRSRGRRQKNQRPYFFIAAINRSTGSAYTRASSAPVIVSAASRALRIDSSVAWTVAANKPFTFPFGSMSTCATPVSAA